MDTICTDINQIKQECKEMQDFLEEEVSNSDIDAFSSRLSNVNVYLARSSKLLADTKYIQDEMVQSYLGNNLELLSRLPATTQKAMIQSATSSINYYVNWLDRLNKSFVHVGDNMRTQISLEKELLRLTKNGY